MNGQMADRDDASMQNQVVMVYLIQRLERYARCRALNVHNGLESPYLAALLLHKFGEGLSCALSILFNVNEIASAAETFAQHMHAATVGLDPAWPQHERERWHARPSDVTRSPLPISH
jgi:hypothetical protein